ncbi:recombinase family protein [Halalkalibacter hemicellulosilyticus]|uniref:Resolvase n=1 Tax=Halalkalibacter hemicellulosilyticusJCM 9152 TaxID=1236971 RepID=W4QLT0_9BACI|nr:recombinase family protein [Halalkalibacter hemicellulosilyticus]GAE32857.1 resolvase [Halalkalibacter hemicellulosilyticusJCM 9152]
MANKIFGYARVSTVNQSLETQIQALESYGVDQIFQEKETGARADRDELQRVLDMLREGDTLVVYKLDRLGRTFKNLIALVEELEEKGVKLISIKENIDPSTPIGKAMMNMIFIVAEMEREVIKERTQSGIETARKRGVKGGRKPVDQSKVNKALKMYDAESFSIAEITKATGVSQGTLYNYIRKRKKENTKGE